MASVPADCVWGVDNVRVDVLPPGFKVYAGYENGPYENMPALERRFPGATLFGFAVRLDGSQGARGVDAEAGTLSASQQGNFEDTAAFLSQYAGTQKPIVYTMASWARDLENYLAAHGHPRSSYFFEFAHYAGQHLCAPDGCGYGASPADATQYATGLNDYTVYRGYVFSGAAAPLRPAGVIAQLGDAGSAVDLVQGQLNAWSRYCGFGQLILDGDYGGKTYSAVRLFQAKRGQGLAVDGVVGSATEKYLRNPPGVLQVVASVVKPVARPVLPAVVLRFGDAGKAVAAVQYYLRNSGITGVRGISADGDFEQNTLTSLRNFQRYAGLNPDGVYGPATRKALAKVAVA